MLLCILLWTSKWARWQNLDLQSQRSQWKIPLADTKEWAVMWRFYGLLSIILKTKITSVVFHYTFIYIGQTPTRFLNIQFHKLKKGCIWKSFKWFKGGISPEFIVTYGPENQFISLQKSITTKNKLIKKKILQFFQDISVVWQY